MESPNRFRRMTLPHAFNLAGSDLIHLRHTANFWAERVEAAAAAAASSGNTSPNGTSSPSKELGADAVANAAAGTSGAGNNIGGKKEKPSRIGKRRSSKPFKRSKTLMESN